jgi:RNA polymerase sigma-70 factor (ECF subfamily)
MPRFFDITLDDCVLERARAGDRAAHEQLYAAFAGAVYSLIRRLVVRPAVAEELAQDVFVEILRGIGDYQGIGSFAGWVRSIAVTRALMHLRSPWHRLFAALDPDTEATSEHGTYPAGNSQPGYEPSGNDLPTDDLEWALNQLPAVGRSVVWLHDVEGYTHGEIARLYGRTASFSKSQLARAHEQLRDLLEPQPGGLACTPLSRN